MFKKIVCLYHSPCNDGLTSAWVFDRYANRQEAWKGIPIEIKGVSHEDGIGDLAQYFEANVFFIDFSIKRDKLITLSKIANFITIIDHHKTAQENLVDLPANIEVHFDMKKCGCTLAWNYFFGLSPYEDMPSFLEYIQDTDIWTKKLENTEEFVAWLDDASPKTIKDIEHCIWHWNTFTEHCVKHGASLLSYKDSLIQSVINYAYETTLDGVKIVKINSPYNKLNSELGMRLSKLWQLPSWVWHEAKVEDGKVIQKNSLRSLDHLADVSELAKRFGGGGHRNASGFVGVGRA